MKNKSTSASPARSSASSAKATTTQKSQKSKAIPDDIRRNTYTQDRPSGLHTRRLGNQHG